MINKKMGSLRLHLFCSDGKAILSIYYISDRKEIAKVYAEIYFV